MQAAAAAAPRNDHCETCKVKMGLGGGVVTAGQGSRQRFLGLPLPRHVGSLGCQWPATRQGTRAVSTAFQGGDVQWCSGAWLGKLADGI
jgi:hypothetical protein